MRFKHVYSSKQFIKTTNYITRYVLNSSNIFGYLALYSIYYKCGRRSKLSKKQKTIEPNKRNVKHFLTKLFARDNTKSKSKKCYALQMRRYGTQRAILQTIIKLFKHIAPRLIFVLMLLSTF